MLQVPAAWAAAMTDVAVSLTAVVVVPEVRVPTTVPTTANWPFWLTKRVGVKCR